MTPESYWLIPGFATAVWTWGRLPDLSASVSLSVKWYQQQEPCRRTHICAHSRAAGARLSSLSSEVWRGQAHLPLGAQWTLSAPEGITSEPTAIYTTTTFSFSSKALSNFTMPRLKCQLRKSSTYISIKFKFQVLFGSNNTEKLHFYLIWVIWTMLPSHVRFLQRL